MKIEIVNSQAEGFFSKLIQLPQDKDVKEYLNLLEDKHNETHGHCVRVCKLAIDLGFDNKLDQYDMHCLGLAGLVHDFGKMKIPDNIISKSKALNSKEYRIIKGHVRLGFIEINTLENGIIGQIVATHHEFKTEPYPRNNEDRREEVRQSDERRKFKPRIKYLGQILAVSDIVDALIHSRTYRSALTLDETKEILKNEFTGDRKLINQVLRRIS